MLKAGFIGAGNRSQGAHYPNVQRLEEDVEMLAVCELDEDRLDQVATKYEFPHTYTDHRKMLDEADPDIVYCVMNEKWILQPALDCLNAGKHMFIEKPPGKNSDETQQLLDAAVANDVYCMVGFQRRHTAITREAMRLVNDKGPVSTVVTTFNKQILGGDGKELTTTLWNDIVHIVDLTRFMAGGEPVEVTAYQDKFSGDSYNHYSALVRFDNHVTGIIMGNRASGGRVLRSELHGPGIGCYMKIPAELEILEDNQSRVLGGWEIEGVDKEDTASYEGALDMHRHFIDCIHNKKVPTSDLRDAIHSIRLVDQIEATDWRS
ncbi:MAG: Gfo/Idh/MocA family oxidoreductase [bacterium]|nr:Gfo/Idh/MocA family oxidoreductase [bacterium]